MNLISRHRDIGLLLTLFCSMYLLGLAIRPMMRPDEFRYAEIPREMMASGDYVLPRFNGIRYFEKPVLGYHLTAACFKVFGLNRFALRFPSAMAVLISALCLYWLMRRYGQDALLPFVSAAVFMTMGMVWGIGTFAVLDSQLACSLTCTIAFFYGACHTPSRSKCILLLLLAGGCAGIAFLLKGFLAFAVPVVVLVPFLVWERRWKPLFLYPWLPMLASLLVIVPWGVAIFRRDPNFWHYFVVVEHFQRFTSNTLDCDPEPFWFYLPMLAGILPGGFLLLGAIRGWGRELLKNSLFRCLCCWTVMPFLFFSASSCKVGTYILPCFAPLACLIAWGALNNWRTNAERFARGMRLFSTCLAGFASGVALAALLLVLMVSLRGAFVEGRMLVAGKLLLLLLVASGWAVCLWQMRRCVRGSFLTSVLGLACLLPVALWCVPYQKMGSKMPEADLRACLQQAPITPDMRVFAYRTAFSPAAWILQRNDIILTDDMSELEYGMKTYPQESDGRFIQIEADMMKQYGGNGPNVFITIRNLKKDPLDPCFDGCKKVQYGCALLVFF